MKKYFMITIVVAMMFFVAACEGDGDDSEDRTNPYRGGTESLSISFDNDNPPDEVYDDTPFFIGLDIRNNGEYPVPQDEFEVKIRGLNPETYGTSSSDLTSNLNTDLQPTRLDVDGSLFEGGEDYMEFGPLEYSDELSTVISDVPVQAQACYSYGTEVVSELCIKEDVSRDKPGDVCKANDEKTYYNSAGPVQVTSFKQSPRGSDKISFNFRVEHKGVGKVYSRGGSCGNDATENEVLVKVDGPAGTDCSTLSGTEGSVRIGDTGRSVSCSLDVSDASSSYSDQITIDLEYTYQQTVTSTIDVKPVN
ncbi:MAG: hypothetical protein ACLFNK_01730 [Candidatus Woesearchaeota archaeon]